MHARVRLSQSGQDQKKLSKSEKSPKFKKTPTKKLSYRQKLKLTDPASYDAYKRADALRHRIARRNMSEEERKEYNRKGVVRNAKLKAREKETAVRTYRRGKV